jgi:RNase H-fold protein (predicted Holliday junction resolvase)
MSAPLLAIDPGRDKCGLAVVSREGAILRRRVVPRAEIVAAALSWSRDCSPDLLLLGSATGARELETELRAAFPLLPLHIVDEHGSTLEARALFWQEHPPRGWRKLLPVSLQTPPSPLDDLAAVVLARRFLAVQGR